MSMDPGTTLGRYEIVEPLGAGGMGEVYLATDTRLKREVALKILPATSAEDPEWKARFRREAEVLASLNHPNIAGIYGLEEKGSTQAIAMELVEGETLAARIGRGALPLQEALRIALQIVEALEAAHGKGIVHRDLKPANVIITPEGTAKVLDFGLAKALEREGAADADITRSPTRAPQATQPGIVLGTAAYMSPEQAKGRAADHRSDVWSFGVVLFEMLAGRSPLPGEDLTEVLASVVKVDVDWEALPSRLPAVVRRWLERCLQADPGQRYQAVGDIRLDIEQYVDDPEATSSAFEHPVRGAGLNPAAVGVGLALAVVLTAVATWWLKPVPEAAPARRLEISLGADAPIATPPGVASGETGPVLSPDGARLAFVARPEGGRQQLYVRALDRLVATPLAGTAGARQPFFSPDGTFLGFFADGKLKKVSVAGGTVTTLCDAPLPLGGDWGEDGSIVFAEAFSSPLSRVSAAGGTPRPVTTIDSDAGEVSQRWPQLLPGSRAVLFTAFDQATGWDDARVVVQRIPDGERKVLHRGGYHGRYVPSGHLTYIRDGTLFAAPFDPEALEITGQAIPVLEELLVVPTNGSAYFSYSDNGTLVYVRGSFRLPESKIHWLTRAGGLEPLWDESGTYRYLSLSPDGRRLATGLDSGDSSDIWIYEPDRQARARLTVAAAADQVPLWSPAGDAVAFQSRRDGEPGIFWKRADGSGEAQRLTENPNPQSPQSWHPTGEFLAFHELSNDTSWDIRILPLERDDPAGWRTGPIRDFLRTPFIESHPAFSPDGRWLAYQSAEAGQTEVYVSPFPAAGARFPVSTGGGLYPLWSKTDARLFYLAPDGRIMAVTYSTDGNSWQSSRPTRWSDVRVSASRFARDYDQHPDGERFAVLLPGQVQQEADRTHVILIEEFFDRLRGDAGAR